MPKVNKQIWQQMRQEGLLISGLCAILEVCNVSDGDKKSKLAHAAVLLLTANREFNMKRRDLIRPDLNKQYGTLCNPSTAISTYLFGDELNKEVKLSPISLATKLPLSPVRITVQNLTGCPLA